jgi:hypothetical protein
LRWSKTAKLGQPCSACQTTSGAARTANRTAPQTRHRLRSSGRAAGVTAKPRPSAATRKPTPHLAGGYGLAGIAERVASCGGSLTLGPAPDGGFTVTARLPLT